MITYKMKLQAKVLLWHLFFLKNITYAKSPTLFRLANEASINHCEYVYSALFLSAKKVFLKDYRPSHKDNDWVSIIRKGCRGIGLIWDKFRQESN